MATIEAWARYLPPRTAQKGPAGSDPPRTAAAWDEDSFTMALEAATRCLRRRREAGSEEPVRTLLCVRSPESGEAGDRALLDALGLEPSTRVIGFPASPDAAADALDLALGAVEAGDPGSVLLIASSDPGQGSGGDGAAALALGEGGPVQATGRAFVNLARVWPQPAAAAVVPSRFDAEEVSGPALEEAFAAAGTAPGELDAWAFSGPSARRASSKLGLGEPLEAGAPYAGALGAELLIGLGALFARAGRSAAVSLGERAAVFLWRSSEQAGEAEADPVPESPALSFAEYTVERSRRGGAARQQVNPMDYVREAASLLRLEGARCSACGWVDAASATTAGRSRVEVRCERCGEECEPVALSREGTVAAFTVSEMEAEPTAYAVCDLDGGGRMLLELAGGGSSAAAVGERVELVLRRGPNVAGVGIYLWKALVRG